MEFLIIIPIILYMFVLVPAFMFTWEGSVFEGIGCYGWFCMFVGFPGALLALLIKGIIKLFKLPGEIREKEESERRKNQEFLERCKQEKEEEERQLKYERSLIDKKENVFPNSPATKDIINIITGSGVLPYLVELKNNGATIYFENSTKTYIYASHGFPNMDQNEEEIFANVLNNKLDNRYSISEEKEYHSFKYSDGTPGVNSTHISYKMNLIATREF